MKKTFCVFILGTQNWKPISQNETNNSREQTIMNTQQPSQQNIVAYVVKLLSKREIDQEEEGLKSKQTVFVYSDLILGLFEIQ
jgi:hypothetical protein